LYPDFRYLNALALYAGKIITQNFKLGMDKKIKADNTPVTITDTTINDYVVDKISKDYPHINIIAEEGDKEIIDAEYTLYCDPVDGTIPFTLGIPVSAFCIAVVKGDTPLVSVIYDPFQLRLWHATRGAGAWLSYGINHDIHNFMQPKRIHVSTLKTLKHANLSLIWWKNTKYNMNQICDKIMAAGALWNNAASLAYFGGLIAAGTMDGSIFPGQKAWETTAMQVLVEEAGGKVTDIYGDPMQYGLNGSMNGHIISNGLIHDELVQIVQSVR
jgi:fructose-1,6-bisphosphatase/inositol monophosphatase family enzyme